MIGIKRLAALAAASMAAMVLLASALTAAETDAAILKPDDAGIVSRGQTVYMSNCASCHGQRLEGQPDWRIRDQEGYLPAPPHDETGHSWHHSDELLFKLTKYGLAALAGADYKTRMPAYEGILSDEDLIAVLSFIKSRWPESIRTRHDRLNAAASRAAGSRR